MTALMTPLEKALAWHKLSAWRNPNDRAVQHVNAIVAELERLQAGQTNVVVVTPAMPDPALVARLRSAAEFGEQRNALAVPVDLPDVHQLVELLEPTATLRPTRHSHLRQTGRAHQETGHGD